MRTPFEYGGSISGPHFVNRTRELDLLQRNFAASQNTVLISPRRWGKSSLVNRALSLAQERQRNLRVVQLDMLPIRTESQFLAAYLQATLRALGGTGERAMSFVRESASVLLPKLTFSAGTDASFRVGFDWRQDPQDREAILQLPERLAARHELRVVVAIDEFQGVAEIEDASNFDATLRTNWQHHRRVGYCLYGSQRHMMIGLFGSYGAPFYHFADTHVLDKISREHWVSYIVDRFTRFGKSISSEVAEMLATFVDDHSHYVQQIAQIAFGLTDKRCTAEIARTAQEQLVFQVEPFFSQQISRLSRTQLGFLRALLAGHQAFSSKPVLDEFGLGSSANASKLKRVMQERELVQLNREGRFEFVDPVFATWLGGRLG